MNSKQINFFITPEDKTYIADFLKTNNCLLIENNISNPQISTNSLLERENIFQLFFTHKNYEHKIFFKHLKEKNYYYLDIVKSCAIEFDLGGFYPYSDKELHRGRFYCVYKYYDDEILVSKNDNFLLWTNDVFSAFKKGFLTKKSEYMGYYFSKNAIKWVQKNNAKLLEGGLKFVSSHS